MAAFIRPIERQDLDGRRRSQVPCLCEPAPWACVDAGTLTGQRQGDLLSLTWGQYDGEWIHLRQGKTGTYVEIPVAAPLKAVLDAEKRRGTVILMSSDDLPWTNFGFRASWGKAVKKAGITGISFNDTRGSAVTRLAVAGCTVPEIASITGHSLKDVQAILDAHYLSRDPEMAKSAIRKLEKRTKSTNRATNRPTSET